MKCAYHDTEISEEECRETCAINADLLASPCASCPLGRETASTSVYTKAFPPPGRRPQGAKNPRKKLLRDCMRKRSFSDWKNKKKLQRYAITPEPIRLSWAILHAPDSCRQRGVIGLRMLTKHYNTVSAPQARICHEDMGKLLKNYGLRVKENALGKHTPGLMLDWKTQQFTTEWKRRF